ncbi:MAG: ComEC/Rec2 family competence protein [Synergistaceae bacterium]|nr:ComEC/Rec2 family competence protein [Synergistaceae bacterium]
MLSRRDGPLSYAPAFAALLGISFSLYASYLGCSLFVSAVISILTASSWIFMGTADPPDGWISAFAAVVILTFAASLWLSIRIVSEYNIPSTIRSEGRVLMNRQWGSHRALLISTEFGNMTAYLHPSSAPAEGSDINLRAAVFDFQREKKEGFDEYLYWRSKGALKKILLLDLEVTAPPSGLSRWRNFLEKKIREDLPDQMSGYMLALTLGIRDKKLTEMHRKAGTVHLLAVSGFHVGILAGLAGIFLRRGRSRIVLISLLVWFYIALAGFPAGGVRAGIMLQVYLLGLFLGRPSDPFNSVSTAGIIMLLWNPWIFHDIGWRLSMLAALFICAASVIVKRNKAGALMVSSGVWLVTAPIVVSYFGKVPVVGLFINIAAVPLFAVIFPLVFLCSLPAFFALPFSNNVTSICEYILEGWDIMSRKTVEMMPWNIISACPLTIFALLLFFAAASYVSGVYLKRMPAVVFMFSLLVLLLA